MDATTRPGGHERPPGTGTVDLDGCVNFRDIGGYATADGGRVRRGRLYRADGLNRLSDRDIDTLRALDVRTVVDLRTPSEAETRGNFPVDRLPVTFVALPLTDVLPAPEELPEWKETGFVAERYVEMVEGGRDAIAATFAAVAAAGAMPAVVHCSAGKDRTGILSALVLGFLGVPRHVIVDDYALSAEAMIALLERLKLEYADAVAEVERYAPAVISVSPQTMAAFLDTLEHEHGSFDELARSLGVTDAVTRLRAALLETP